VRKLNVRERARVYIFIYTDGVYLFKDQPEDGPTIGPKHVAGIIIWYIIIEYKIVYDCIVYILYYILAYIQHNGDVSLENHDSGFLHPYWAERVKQDRAWS
jgi:hypothetical protein